MHSNTQSDIDALTCYKCTWYPQSLSGAHFVYPLQVLNASGPGLMVDGGESLVIARLHACCAGAACYPRGGAACERGRAGALAVRAAAGAARQDGDLHPGVLRGETTVFCPVADQRHSRPLAFDWSSCTDTCGIGRFDLSLTCTCTCCARSRIGCVVPQKNLLIAVCSHVQPWLQPGREGAALLGLHACHAGLACIGAIGSV